MILAQYRLLTLPLDPATPTDGFNMECRIYWVDGMLSGLPRVRGANERSTPCAPILYA